jgi:hypothetical protein
MDAHSCLGCGRLTTAKCQICPKCRPNRETGNDKQGSAGSTGPFTELAHECSYDYSEDSLGPHSSDERWSWGWVDDVWNNM